MAETPPPGGVFQLVVALRVLSSLETKPLFYGSLKEARAEQLAAQHRNLSTNPATLRRPLVTYLVDSIATPAVAAPTVQGAS